MSKWSFVKRTPRGSVVGIEEGTSRCFIKMSSHEDVQGISNLLNSTGIEWTMYLGPGKGWDGRHKGWWVEFSFSDLEEVIIPLELERPLLEGRVEG